MPRRRPAFAVWLLVGLVVALPARADAAELFPTTLVLSEDNPVAVLYIRNTSSERVVYELRGFRWTQENGEDVHDPDADLVATPPVLVLEPGESAPARIGLLSGVQAGPVERAYRLLISDIPPPARHVRPGLDVRVQYLLPVFVPPMDQRVRLELAATEDEAGRLCISGRNGGTSHAKIVSLGAAEAAAARVPTHRYILAGARAQFCVAVPAARVSAQKLSAGVTSAYQKAVTIHAVATAPAAAALAARH